MTKLSNIERAAKIASNLVLIIGGLYIASLIVMAAIEQLGREPGVVTLF